MTKRKYRSVKLADLDRARFFEKVQDREITVGIDVAKHVQFAAFMSDEDEVLETVRWLHPAESRDFVGLLVELPVSKLEAAMEPTGTYGDSLRYLMLNQKVSVFRISAKRVHDGREVYDGVASSHDAKAAAIIAKLQRDKLGEPWPMAEEDDRSLESAIKLMNIYDRQEQTNLNNLEALLARHWPELLDELDLTTVTLPTLLSHYGDPAMVALRLKEAERLMRRTGRSQLSREKIVRIVSSAPVTVGVPMFEGERELVKAVAADMLRARRSAEQAKRQVERLSRDIPSVAAMGAVVGQATSAVLACKGGSPLKFESARAFEKTLGLNLKEQSSGKHKGQLKITKRGSGMARQYLYLAVLRLLQSDPVVKAWYLKKVQRDGGKLKMKGVVAVMRKLARALWHVARGEQFDSTKLFDVSRLNLGSAN